MKKSERISAFVTEIWQWYAQNKRDLPWRDLDLSIEDDTQRAYQVLVSEIMLQQTQVSRVIVIYKRFLEQFPTLQDLASASNKDVILAWRGMGYNSRALRLRDCALRIIENPSTGSGETGQLKTLRQAPSFAFGLREGRQERLENEKRNSQFSIVNSQLGLFPRDMNDLMALPGVGHYTAGAIRNFAFHIPTPCIDTNIRRILHRTFVGPEDREGKWKKDDQYLLKIAEEVLEEAQGKYVDSFLRCFVSSQGGETRIDSNKRINEKTKKRASADWHAALMDFGSIVCTKRNPDWDNCPLTAKGISKSSYKTPANKRTNESTNKRSEPGRYVGSTYIPNRIFRGRVVDELRDELEGLEVEEIGRRVCIDWDPQQHQEWLCAICEKLMKDALLARRGEKFVLAD